MLRHRLSGRRPPRALFGHPKTESTANSCLFKEWDIDRTESRTLLGADPVEKRLAALPTLTKAAQYDLGRSSSIPLRGPLLILRSTFAGLGYQNLVRMRSLAMQAT
jgi:hypothetical protein